MREILCDLVGAGFSLRVFAEVFYSDPVAAGFSLRVFTQVKTCDYHSFFAQVKTCGYPECDICNRVEKCVFAHEKSFPENSTCIKMRPGAVS